MNRTCLVIKNLSSGYGEKPVLSDIDIKVDSGEIVTIIGPNGSGKTTLLRAVSRYQFVPGRQDDRPMAMRVQVPVHFRLQDAN